MRVDASQLRKAVGCVLLMGAIVHGDASVSWAAGAYGVGGGTRIVNYALSPNGRRLAEVRLSGASGTAAARIVVVKLSGSLTVARTVFQGDSIGQILWENNRNLLIVQSGAENSITREDVDSASRLVIFKSKHPISIAAYDRVDGLLAYEYSVPWSWRGRVSVRMRDYMNTLEILAPRWARWPGTVHVKAIRIAGAGRAQGAQSIPLAMSRFHIAPNLAWRNGRLLALVSRLKSWRTELFDLGSGQRLASNVGLYRMSGLTVSPSGGIAVVSNRLYKSHQKPISCGCNGSMNLFRVSMHGAAHRVSAMARGRFIEDVAGLWWAPNGRLFAQVMGYRGHGGAPRWFLEEVSARRDHLIRRYYWPGGDLGAIGHMCAFDAQRTVAICVRQTLRDPPALVVVTLKTGAMRVVGPIDPRQRRLNFRFVKLRVHSRFGHASTGFLAIPRQANHHAVPLAVMAYGFTESYSRDAQWISSYPVARMVHAGIAVLLMNWARVGATNLGSYQESKRALESAVSLYGNAITAVERRGVHVSRAMLMGWSFGGLFAAHAIQRLPAYVAAQVGDPADYSVTAYGLGGEFWRNQSKVMFGGPPFGRYLSRYQYFDPVGEGHPARGPILLEFVSRNPAVGQLLEEWRAAGTEVEAFAYRRSVHWLSVPAEAKISRQRNFLWAKLNLFGPSAVSKRQLERVGLTVPTGRWWNSRQRNHAQLNREYRLQTSSMRGPTLLRRQPTAKETEHRR